jgi:hypothetical protein
VICKGPEMADPSWAVLIPIEGVILSLEISTLLPL